MLGFATEGLY